MSANPTERSDLDATPQAPQGAPGLGVRGWLRWFWRQLTSMRTALILLFLLALASIPGSILPQRGVAPEKVDLYIKQHDTIGPIFDRLSLFDVFAAPWFAAIYLLLFISLAGCVLPRSWQHVKTLRARPPAAPRNLSRMPESGRWHTELPPEDALDRARTMLKRKRFRVDTAAGSVSAEKGYLRETGNLLFHIALLGLLLAIGSGGAFGYKGNVLVTGGDSFANTVTSYDRFRPGRIFSASGLQPFSFRVDDFNVKYITKGKQRGEPSSYSAQLTYQASPDSPKSGHNLRVNYPLEVDGTKVYLLGHGYSPTFKVVDGKGHVAYQGATPFLNSDEKTMTSQGVIKAPDAQPDQLGFLGVFLPTTVQTKTGLVSAFPAPINPTVTLLSFSGDLGLDSGQSQSTYQLDTEKLHKIKGKPQTLKQGDTYKLPGGKGSITFTGYKQWASLAVTYDPGRVPALVAAILAILGLMPGLLVQRRRVWVRARLDDDGRTVVETGGLSRTDAGGAFTAEFGELTTDLRSEVPPAEQATEQDQQDPQQGKE